MEPWPQGKQPGVGGGRWRRQGALLRKVINSKPLSASFVAPGALALWNCTVPYLQQMGWSGHTACSATHTYIHYVMRSLSVNHKHIDNTVLTELPLLASWFCSLGHYDQPGEETTVSKLPRRNHTDCHIQLPMRLTLPWLIMTHCPSPLKSTFCAPCMYNPQRTARQRPDLVRDE